MGILTLNPLNYTNVYYVDINIGNDITGNGTINNPYKTLVKCGISINLSTNTLIYLGEGTYDFDLTIPNGGVNCRIAIVGKQSKTILNQIVAFFPNNSSSGKGGNSSFTLEIYNLIYTSNLINYNVNCTKFRWNFYNVVFKNIPNNSYSFFCPDSEYGGGVMLFYNCVKVESSTSFLRTTAGSISLYNCYGAFTSGYSTNQTKWDISGNIITSTPALDSVYHTSTPNVGVYTGDNTWGIKKAILFKDSSNNIYNYNTLNNQYINNGVFDLKNLSDINKNNLYNIAQQNNNVNLVNQIPSQYNPKLYFKNQRFNILYFK